MVVNQSECECTSFWYRCHEAFCEAGVSPKCAADFFKEHSIKMSSCKERYFMYIIGIIFHYSITKQEENGGFFMLK
jgi:hypothetical protein